MLRLTKILLVASVGAWALLGAFGNISDWSNVTHSVGTVASMRTFAPSASLWKAATDGRIVLLGSVAIPFFKMATFSFCAVGAWRMWSQRRATGPAFHRSKEPALVGCAIAVAGLFVGWIVVAEGWFEIWRSPALRDAAAGTAFRYAGFIALIAIMVGMRDD